MASDVAWASDLAAIQEQLAAVLSSQERLAHAVAELRADLAPGLLSKPRRLSRTSCHDPEPRPEAAAGCQDEFDRGEPAHMVDISELAAGASDPTASTGSSESSCEAAIKYALSQGAAPDIRCPHTRRVTRFKNILRYNERAHTLLTRMSIPNLRSVFWGYVTCKGDRQLFENRLDGIVALVILLNTLIMAMEMDADRTPGRTLEGWTVVSIVFSVLFWMELGCRLWLHGFWQHFCGRDWLLSAIDAVLIVADTAQVICVLSMGKEAMKGVPAASLFRLIRIFRITRVIRVLKSPIFNDLLTIVNGLRGGLVTLGWSFVPFFLVLVIASLVCRETIGRGSEENVGPYFDSVPRAILTMLRCGFGDFSSSTGVPIIEHVVDGYGLAWGFFYGVFVFFVSVGVFNVIAAVFLDSTLTATASLQREKLQMRLADKELWYSRVFVIVKHLLPHTDCSELPDGIRLSENADKIMAAEIWRHDITKLARNEEMARALRDLDIDPRDDHILGDIMDADHTGYVTMLEFVNGLQRLRGGSLRRSDVLSVDLMLRALQEKVDEMSCALQRSLGGRGGGKAEEGSLALASLEGRGGGTAKLTEWL